MKKMIIILLAVLAINSASASTFVWGTASKTMFDGTTTGGISATLVYLGATDTALGKTYDINGLTGSEIVDSIGTTVGDSGYTGESIATVGKNLGRLSVQYEFSEGVTGGDYFAILMSYNDGADTWYNLTGAKASVYNSVEQDWGNISFDTLSYAFVNGTKDASKTGTLSTGGGWVAVPEPATGMLALAGLAMLIRRKRA